MVQTEPEDADADFEFEMTIDDEEADEFNLADEDQFAVVLLDEGEYVIEHLELDGWEIDSIDCEGSLDVEEDDTGLSFEVDDEPESQWLRCIFALTSTDGAADDVATDDDDGEGGGTIESLPSTAGSQNSPGTAATSRSQGTASSAAAEHHGNADGTLFVAAAAQHVRGRGAAAILVADPGAVNRRRRPPLTGASTLTGRAGCFTRPSFCCLRRRPLALAPL